MAFLVLFSVSYYFTPRQGKSYKCDIMHTLIVLFWLPACRIHYGNAACNFWVPLHITHYGNVARMWELTTRTQKSQRKCSENANVECQNFEFTTTTQWECESWVPEHRIHNSMTNWMCSHPPSHVIRKISDKIQIQWMWQYGSSKYKLLRTSVHELLT